MNNKSEKQIYLEEYVEINGIQQFLFHRGTRYENPVLLFLHGGPGSAESLFTRAFQDEWEKIYTVVHWDQRGAGKTLIRNPDRLPTIDLMLQDLLEVVRYLKQKYNKQKIVLLGHSWGSVLGTVFIKKHPEEVSCYIGVAQVVNMLENEQVGYNKVKEMIELAGDRKSMAKLKAVGDYPGTRIVFDKEFLKKCNKVRKLQGKYRLGLKIDAGIWIAMFRSPIFRLSDTIAFMKIFRANRDVYPFLGDFDLFSEPPEYEVPVHYILGGSDWQAPYTIAEKYFEGISAQRKSLQIIPDAGHMVMMNQPDLFFKALERIHLREHRTETVP